MKPALPPHEFRELVNQLRDTARTFANTQQLRERIAHVLSEYIEPDHKKNGDDESVL